MAGESYLEPFIALSMVTSTGYWLLTTSVAESFWKQSKAPESIFVWNEFVWIKLTSLNFCL